MSKITVDVADTWFSKFIRLRDGKCMRCGSPVQFNDKGDPISHQNSHYKGRRKEATRFDPDNCITLCYGCHQHWHEHPTEYDEWMVENKGVATVNAINLRTCMYKKKDRKLETLIWRQAYKDLKEQSNGNKITGYKGFTPDWKCQDFQFKLGKSYTHTGKVELCASGFHFCENPIDIFNYYDPTSMFAVVEATGVSKEESDDSKRVAKKNHNRG